MSIHLIYSKIINLHLFFIVNLTEICSMRNEPKERSLDPQDWEAMRQLGHRMVDDMMDYLQGIGDQPAWRPIPEEVVEGFRKPLPQLPQDASSVYEDFVRQVLPYNCNNVHPRFWAWVQGTGTPFGMLADMLASGMNPNVAIGDHAALYVERQVLDWSKEIFGFPATASGILLSGGSIANITALLVARHSFNRQIKQKGLGAVKGQLIVYGSVETHNCVGKAVEVIGVGSENFRKVPVDEGYRIRKDALLQMIREDRAAGHLPFCLVGNAGTVNTGAVDDLAGLAEIAKEEGLWFHVDGAFGSVPKICPEYGDLLKGLEEADSLSFDFHKWFYVNYEVACVLIKDAAAHREAFASSVNYLLAHERGLSGGPDPFGNYGMELSRGFKALKVWMLLKEHGIQEYAQQVRQNLAQCQYLGELVKKSPELELLTEVSLNIVCYRYNPGGLSGEELNKLNKEILMQLHERGIAAPSYTILEGRYAIRVANTNYRSKKEDFDALADASLRIGRQLAAQPVHN